MANRGQTAYWSCLRTRRDEEWRAAHNIEAQGFEFYRPVMWVSKGGASGRAPMFPGFIFVRIGPRQNWRPLCSTRGVRNFVVPWEPARSRVRNSEIADLRDLEDERGVVVIPSGFRPGNVVKVVAGDGHLIGQEGVVRRERAPGIVCVSFSILGGQADKELDVCQLGEPEKS
jgi:transcription antitermination factor NusG